MRPLRSSAVDNNLNIYMDYEQWDKINSMIQGSYRKRLIYERKQREKYYAKQRRIGIKITLCGVIFAVVCYFSKVSVLSYIGVVLVCGGLYTAFTRNMIIVDDYYLDCQERINNL